MSNNIGTTDVTPTQSNKEAAINSNFGRVDGKISDAHPIEANGSTSNYSMTTDQWRTHLAIVFNNSVGDPTSSSDTVNLLTTNRTIGQFVIINTLPCAVNHDGYGVPAGTSQSFYWDGATLYRLGADAAVNVYKQAVRIAHGSNVTISTALNNGDSLDGETLVSGDRVLLYGQSDPIENGIYVVAASPDRSTDADQLGEVVPGTSVYVLDGSHAGNYFVCDNTDTPDIGTDAISFTEFAGGGGGGGGGSITGFKNPCRVATTANITIATALNSGDSIDGVTLADGDRVLVKNQSTGGENGIYVVDAVPFRADDFDADADVVGGLLVPVSEGTAGGNKVFQLTTNDPITLGSTALVFQKLVTASTDLSDMPGSFTAVYALRVNAAGNAYEQIVDEKPLCATFGGQPTASEVVFMVKLPFDLTFPTNMSGSAISPIVDPAADYDLDIQLDGVSKGSGTIAAGAFTTTFTVTTFNANKGQVLTVLGDGTPDVDLDSLLFSLIGYRRT